MSKAEKILLGCVFLLQFVCIAFGFANLVGMACEVGQASEVDAEPVKTLVRLKGDDVPAVERCYMTEEEIAEDFENYYIEQALLAKSTKIENCIVTHYCSCAKCCGKSDGIGADGTKVVPGVSVAVDPKVIPLGADVLVDYGDGEIHYYRATDTGVNGNHIDLCVSSHREAINLGVKNATVYWTKSN